MPDATRSVREPHLTGDQRDLAATLAAAGRGDIFLVIAEPGSGKTTAAAWALRRVVQSRGDVRVAVVTPSRQLHEQWLAVLGYFGWTDVEALDATRWRHLQLLNPPPKNPLAAARALVVQAELFQDADFGAAFKRLELDYVVSDEAHLYDSRGLLGQHPAGLAQQELAASGCVVLLALAPTPRPIDWLLPLRVQEVRWAPRGARPWIAELRHRVVEFDRSPEEDRFSTLLEKCCTMAGTREYTSPQARVLVERWESSTYACEQTLTLLARHPTSSRVALDMPDHMFTVSTAAQLDDDTLARSIAEDVPLRPPRPPTPPFRRAYCADMLMEAFLEVAYDSRYETLARELGDPLESPAGTVIFTKYADTADYVSNLLESEGHKVEVLTGRTHPAQRAGVLEAFASGARILVSTEVAVHGLEFDARQVWHFDLPSSDAQLWLRASRVGRQRGDVVHLFLLSADQRPALEALLEGRGPVRR
jgi:hypothetical protein